jgi:hypothetical protein
MDTSRPLDINQTLRQLTILLNKEEPLLVGKLISCSNGSTKTPWEKERDDRIAGANAPGVLYNYLKYKYIEAARARPSEMTAQIFKEFITQPGNTLPPNIKIPQNVLDNTARKDSEQLLRNAGISKLYNNRNSISARMRTPYNEEMSSDNIRKGVLLIFVRNLIKRYTILGRDNTSLRTLEYKISNNIPLTLDKMYMLIHEHIMIEYSKKAAYITTRAELLAFIRTELLVLSQLVTDIYPYYLRMIDFAIYDTYSPLLTKYIELILKQNNFEPVGNSTKIAESIKIIVFEHICPFFKKQETHFRLQE